jgi:hypothetical protein
MLTSTLAERSSAEFYSLNFNSIPSRLSIPDREADRNRCLPLAADEGRV